MWHTHTGTSENIQGSLIVQKLAKKDGCEKHLNSKVHGRNIISLRFVMGISLDLKNLTDSGQKRTLHTNAYYKQACSWHLDA